MQNNFYKSIQQIKLMHVFTTSETCLHVHYIALACTIAGYKIGNRINIDVVSCFMNQ